MSGEICPECASGVHKECIGQGCYCDCQIEPEDGDLDFDEDRWEEADDCLDCGMCDSCIERTKAHFEEMLRAEQPRGGKA